MLRGTMDLGPADRDAVWRLLKVGGALIAATLTISAFATAQADHERRLVAIEQAGSPPFQQAFREVRDSLAAVRREQVVMRYLQCQTPALKTDSFCQGLDRPRGVR